MAAASWSLSSLGSSGQLAMQADGGGIGAAVGGIDGGIEEHATRLRPAAIRAIGFQRIDLAFQFEITSRIRVPRIA